MGQLKCSFPGRHHERGGECVRIHGQAGHTLGQTDASFRLIFQCRGPVTAHLGSNFFITPPFRESRRKQNSSGDLYLGGTSYFSH